MTTAYPGALDAYGDPTGGQVQGSTTPTHSAHHKNHNDAIEAIEAKLGIGASAAAANTVLRGTGAGASAFGQVQAADIVAGAVSTVQGAVGTTTSPQSGATTGAGAPGIAQMLLNVTVEVGDIVLLYFESQFSHDAPGAVSIWDLYWNNVFVQRRQFTCPAANEMDEVTIIQVLSIATAGTFQADARFWVTGGTVTALYDQRALGATRLRR
jgi:hypothetical protein